MSQPHTNVPPRFLFGAGEAADHVVRLLEGMNLPWQQIELFDDNFPSKSTGPADLPVVGTIDDGLHRVAQDRLPTMVAIGSKGAAFRYGLFRTLHELSVPLSSIIHTSVQIAPGVTLGDNVVIFSGCQICKNTEIASLVTVHTGTVIEHDNSVSENVFIGPGVTTSGNVMIERHAFVGVGAVVSPGATIGTRALIGAGAVVVHDVPPGKVVVGVPARVHRDVEEGMDAPTIAQLRTLGCGDR